MKADEISNWSTYIFGIQAPHVIYAIGILSTLLGVNSFYEEQIMRRHLLYKKFGKVCVAHVIDMEECVLGAGTGEHFYSVIRIDDINCLET